ncbi:hypothetical protein ABK040_016388 [Willaertia magna]
MVNPSSENNSNTSLSSDVKSIILKEVANRYTSYQSFTSGTLEKTLKKLATTLDINIKKNERINKSTYANAIYTMACSSIETVNYEISNRIISFKKTKAWFKLGKGNTVERKRKSRKDDQIKLSEDNSEEKRFSGSKREVLSEEKKAMNTSDMAPTSNLPVVGQQFVVLGGVSTIDFLKFQEQM